jgi:DNA-formamidopyrimidine glycosylase|uniref:Formamidopyrimidine-DNA glycosylase catalytic domain-containing protein n=1 Tax=viral metagenome TaxID=1070528 RepID=A0A6C0IZD0_9ZZZZ
MPESAEVRLTVDYLNKFFQDNTVVSWVFCGGKYTDIYPEGYEEFDESLPLKISEVNCKGKFIYFILDNDDKTFYILHSLMMTGRWQKNYDEHCKWYVELDNGNTVWFRDTRSFATLKFTSNKDNLDEKLNNLGMDILSKEFKLPLFNSLTKKFSNKNICPFLMDQSIISGCGNYIKSEALYESRISPLRKVGDLNDDEINSLFQALYIIPRISYNNKGLSLKDYADENGNQGNHGTKLKIYSKKHATRTKTPDGRYTYWDPKIQK